jgi:hypothetical protein
VLDKKKIQKCHDLTKEKLDHIGVRLETSPRKSLRLLALQSGVSKASANTVTKLLNLRPIQSLSHTRTLSCRLGSKKPVLQVISRTGSQWIS